MDIFPTDIKKEIVFCGQFESCVDSLFLPIPRTDIDRIKDIRLRFWIQPTRDADALVSVHDMHVSLRNTADSSFNLDLTRPFADALAREMSSAPNFRQQYADSLDALFEFLKTMTPPRSADLLKRMATEKERLKASPPLDDMTLGHRGIGWFGTFHPINFQFSQIPLPPLSLHSVLFDSGVITSALSECTAIKTTSCPLFIFRSMRYSPEDPERFEGGRLTVSLELVYSNPVAERLEALHGKLRDLQSSLTQQRQMFLIPVRDKVDEYVQDTEGKLSAIEDTLNTI